MSEGTIMKIGGWKTRTMSDRYSIIRQDDLRSAMEKFQQSENPEMVFSDNPVTSDVPAMGALVN